MAHSRERARYFTKNKKTQMDFYNDADMGADPMDEEEEVIDDPEESAGTDAL